MLKKWTILGFIFSFSLGACIYAGAPLGFASEAKIKVAATSTLFADSVRQIGGDRVEVKAIASPKFSVHFYQPKPSDVRTVANADLYVNWGLDIEAWSDPLLEAAGKPSLFRKGPRNVDVSKNIRLLKVPVGNISRSEGDIHLYGNPHFTLDPRNLKIMAQTIAESLEAFDPDHAALYQENLKNFLRAWDQKIAEWKKTCSHCEGQEIISYHEDTEYLADFLGLKLNEFIEPKPGIPPTPQHLAYLEKYAREHGIKVIALATYFPRDVAERLAKKVGARVVTVAQNVGEVTGTSTVFDFFDYNVKQISEALR